MSDEQETLPCSKCGRPLDEHAGIGLPCPMTQEDYEEAQRDHYLDKHYGGVTP